MIPRFMDYIYATNKTDNYSSIKVNKSNKEINIINNYNNYIINDNNKINKIDFYKKLNKPKLYRIRNTKYNQKMKKNINLYNNFLFFVICFILLNINGILCESYIIVKINKLGTYNIIFDGRVKDENYFCNGVKMHAPNSVIINEVLIDSFTGKYEFTREENTIKLYYDDLKDNYNCLFFGCSDIDEIDCSHLNTSNVYNMEYMFHQCSSLTSLIISNFNTKKVIGMRSMFGYCSSLTSIDVSHFHTPLLQDMAYMFEGCYSLSSIYLLNFNTSNVLAMDRLFHGCSSLTTLDISNFRTSKVEWMNQMFKDCYLLTTLDLSNFDTSSLFIFIKF